MRKLRLDELGRISPEEFRSAEKIRVSILLDNVRSMNNVGSAFRTSDAFRIEKIYLSGITATPPHRDIRKTALGAEESMDWEYTDDPVKLVQYLRSQGYRILSVEQAEGSTELQEFDPSLKADHLLIFGNEVDGVSDSLISLSDACIEIPQYGTKHSLNVSVSLGIVLYHFACKLLTGK